MGDFYANMFAGQQGQMAPQMAMAQGMSQGFGGGMVSL